MDIDENSISDLTENEAKQALLNALHVMKYSLIFPEDTKFNNNRMKEIINQFSK